MKTRRRRQLASKILDGYASGSQATTEATARALAKTVNARSVVLVEGISDQIALESLAARRGRDLDAERVVVLPVGGAHGMGRFLARFGPNGRDLQLAGLCDAAEEEAMRRNLSENGIEATSRLQMEQAGFFVCVEDLEDELIRAAGIPRVEALLDSEGDLNSFRTMQNQPAWRDQSVEAQFQRFLGAGARRKPRYARLLVGSIELDHTPRPLDAVLNAVKVGTWDADPLVSRGRYKT